MRRTKRPTIPLRNVATGLVSVLALAGAGAFLATPTQTVLAIDLRVMAATRVPARHEVIYGTARGAAGQPLPGVRILVGWSTVRGFKAVVSFKAARNGTFREVVALPSGRYVIKIILKSGGSTVTATRAIHLSRGTAYSLTIRKHRAGGLFVLPVRGY